MGNHLFLIGLGRGDARGVEIASVPAGALQLPAVRDGKLECFYRDEICLAERPCDLRRGDDRDGGAVRDAAAIIKTERCRDHRRVHHRLDIDGFRSEEHTTELQSLMRTSYAVFSLT